MNADEKLAKIACIFDREKVNDDGSVTTTNAYLNLMGAIHRIERNPVGAVDSTCMATLRRVLDQLCMIGHQLESVKPTSLPPPTADKMIIALKQVHEHADGSATYSWNMSMEVLQMFAAIGMNQVLKDAAERTLAEQVGDEAKTSSCLG